LYEHVHLNTSTDTLPNHGGSHSVNQISEKKYILFITGPNKQIHFTKILLV